MYVYILMFYIFFVSYFFKYFQYYIILLNYYIKYKIYWKKTINDRPHAKLLFFRDALELLRNLFFECRGN